MTERERQYQALGIEYAEGIEQTNHGTVILNGKKFHYEHHDPEYKGQEQWEGWYNGEDHTTYTAHSLLELFQDA